MGALPRIWYLLTRDRSGRLRGEREWAFLSLKIKRAERLIGISTTQDYVEALAQIAHMPPDREEYLRRKLWWASNDHLRRESNAQTLDVDAERANMERLLALLPFTPTLERVELYRQLGCFQEALALLPSVKADQWVKADLQRQWATAGDSTMRVIPPQTAAHARKPQRGSVVWRPALPAT